MKSINSISPASEISLSFSWLALESKCPPYCSWRCHFRPFGINDLLKSWPPNSLDNRLSGGVFLVGAFSEVSLIGITLVVEALIGDGLFGDGLVGGVLVGGGLVGGGVVECGLAGVGLFSDGLVEGATDDISLMGDAVFEGSFRTLFVGGKTSKESGMSEEFRGDEVGLAPFTAPCRLRF
jgi:hypothetical protein